MSLQPQRIPLGTVDLAGRKVPVFITIEWYRALQSLEGATVTTTPSPAPAPAPGAPSTADPDAIESAYQLATAVQAITMALAQRLEGFDTDPDAMLLRAEVDMLRDRVAALEARP